MRFLTAPTLLFFGLVTNIAYALPRDPSTLDKPKRVTSILNNPGSQADLPSSNGAAQAASAHSLNLDNIQGDILIGMKKRKQLFYFFQITDAKQFKKNLRKSIHDLITTTSQLLDVSKQPITAVNIAFSQNGLFTLGVSDDLGDTPFAAGQFANAIPLGDPGTGNWVPAFQNTSLHGLFMLASDTWDNINQELSNLQSILTGCIQETYRLKGEARPGDQEGHEHFGFMDGISQPGINGFTTHPVPGQTVIDPGNILVGNKGDRQSRPSWTKDGSFLAFRQLQQLVPEFNQFLTDNPIQTPGLTPQQGSELMGARMVGRWRSGAPVDLAPLFDDPVLGADPNRNNNFDFSHEGEDLQSNQTRCPFSAHIRKTAPRADLNPVNTLNHIIRAGIPYGPEVTPEEAQSNKTTIDRGLAFVAYQSNIGQGFQFQQQQWSNSPVFVFGKNDTTPGFDPISGANHGAPRTVSGLDPTDANKDFTLITDWVVSKGGEYFFSPPLSAIAGRLAK